MAWDALASQFQRKEKRDEEATAEMRGGGPVTGGGGPAVTSAQNTAFQGSGGSAGGPVSSRFVNFGTLLEANKDKASKMAGDIYRGAESKAEGAKGSLGAAMSQFAGKAQQGTGKSGTIYGQHGTEYATPAPVAPPPTDKRSRVQKYRESVPLENRGTHYSATPVGPGTGIVDQGQPTKLLQTQGTGGSVYIDTSQQEAEDGVQQRQSFDYRKLAGQAAVDAGRYSSILGEGGMYGNPLDMDSATKGDAVNFNHFVNEMDMKSGAGQQYTGPASLKDDMGEEAYGKLQDELRKGEEATQLLTNAGGIGQALGYGPDSNVGMSALDTGLTQVAGQSNFKKLADRYKGLGKTLGAAQTDSVRTAAAGATQSAAAAAEWQRLLDGYNEANKPVEQKPDTAQDDAYIHSGDMNAFAVWSGATPGGQQTAHDTAGGVEMAKQNPREQLEQMGFSGEQIANGFMGWRRAHPGQWPTADQVAAFILSGAK